MLPRDAMANIGSMVRVEREATRDSAQEISNIEELSARCD
jgi:hypothetical protein